jgi:hypothetical protein
MEIVGILYGQCVYFIAIWYTEFSFGIFYGHLVHFVTFWYVVL